MRDYGIPPGLELLVQPDPHDVFCIPNYWLVGADDTVVRVEITIRDLALAIVMFRGFSCNRHPRGLGSGCADPTPGGGS